MITHIRVQNFKSWQDSGEVKLAPLTGFFGTNSSGKSSLLQMLLLLKQTTEHSDPEEVIFFGDENSLVNLGNFREVIHGHKDDELLTLEFGCKLQNSLTIDILQELAQKLGRYGLNDEYIPLDIDSFTFETVCSENASGGLVENFSYTVGLESMQKIKWEKERVYYGNRNLNYLRIENCYGSPYRNSDNVLDPLPSAFEELFSNVYYLGPTRVHPQRLYYWEGTPPTSVGQSGNYTIASLLNARVEQLTTPYEGQDVPIEQRISWWLREMELGYSFSIQRTSTGKHQAYDVLIQKGHGSAQVTLTDMGYGLSQILPVLVHCYYPPEGSTLILEEPGTHLHPKAQADLADLLIEVIKERNVQILVESHSEHLLNRLQRRIAEEKIAADQTALYFCQNDGGVSEIKRLEMDELGNIKNWPKNFFGNEMGDLVAMAKAQMARRKKAEG